MFNYPIEMSINGTRVKSPKNGGITSKDEKIWSRNTGRSGSDKMNGKIKSIKTTYSIEWPPLTFYEKELIRSLVSNKLKPFNIITVRQPDGSVWEMECYFGTPSFTEWNWINGQWMCTDAKVDAIER